MSKSSDPIVTLFNQMGELERMYDELDETLSTSKIKDWRTESEKDHCYDQILSLRQQLSFMEPTTLEGATALMIVRQIFNALVEGNDDEGSFLRDSDSRAADRCHYAALRFLATEEQRSIPSANNKLDPWSRRPFAKAA